MATLQMNLNNNNNGGILDINNNIKYNIRITEHIVMTLKKMNESTAIVFFTCDIENNKINIPDEFVIYDNTNHKNLNRFTKQYFLLCWTDSYIMRFHNEIILDMLSQHTWNLIVPPNRQIFMA